MNKTGLPVAFLPPAIFKKRTKDASFDDRESLRLFSADLENSQIWELFDDAIAKVGSDKREKGLGAEL